MAETQAAAPAITPPAAAPTVPARQPAAARGGLRSRRRRRGDRPAGLVALLAAMALALYTQEAVTRGASGEHALLGFGASAALFVVGLARSSETGLLTWDGPSAVLARPERRTPAARSDAVSRISRAPVHARLLLVSLALGLITFLASSGNEFRLLNTTTWALSVILALIACWDPRPQILANQGQRSPEQTWRATAESAARVWGRVSRQVRRLGLGRVSWAGLALAAILALGAFLLFYRLGDVPRDMTSDHAEKLLDVQDVLDGQHRIFFPRNTGREAFQFYWIAIMTPLTGVSYLTMKLGTALLAWLSLPFMFLFARALFGTPTALLSTAVLASSRWLLQVGRVGLRYPFSPLFGAAIFYWLVKALRHRRRNDFLLCGLALGVAQHTYTPLRAAPLAVAACMVVALVVDVWQYQPPRRVRRLVVDTVLLFAVAALVFAPLARYATEQPRMFLYRGLTRIASDSLDTPPGSPLATFAGNVKNAFVMFNWRGDIAWLSNIPGERMADPISGAMFVLGAAYAVHRLVRYRELPYLYLFILFFVGLLPSTLSLAFPGENPSAVRASLVLPVAALVISWPVVIVVRRLLAWPGGVAGRLGAVAFLAVFVGVIVRANFDQYFRVYARQHAVASQHTSYVGPVVRAFLESGGQREDVFIVTWPYWFDTRLVAIEAGSVRWNPLVQSVEDGRKRDGVGGERLFIVHPDDTPSLDKLAAWYPSSRRQVFSPPELEGRPWFVAVYVPAGASAAG